MRVEPRLDAHIFKGMPKHEQSFNEHGKSRLDIFCFVSVNSTDCVTLKYKPQKLIRFSGGAKVLSFADLTQKDSTERFPDTDMFVM